MKNQMWMMLICCLGPLLVFIIAPLLGVNGQNLSWILIIPIMLLVCFMMMGKGGGCCGSHKKDENENSKKEGGNHGCH